MYKRRFARCGNNLYKPVPLNFPLYAWNSFLFIHSIISILVTDIKVNLYPGNWSTLPKLRVPGNWSQPCLCPNLSDFYVILLQHVWALFSGGAPWHSLLGRRKACLFLLICKWIRLWFNKSPNQRIKYKTGSARLDSVIAESCQTCKWAIAWQNQQNDMCTQQRLRSVWAFAQSDQSPLSAWRNLGSLAAQWAHNEDWSDWANAQADPSLCWVHRSYCWLCHSTAQIKLSR